MGNFRKLIVWLKAKELAVRIYKLGRIDSLSKDFGLKDQIQRACVSIPANIAEGDALGTDKQSIRHFYIAKLLKDHQLNCRLFLLLQTRSDT